jgi:hypothetical protein
VFWQVPSSKPVMFSKNILHWDSIRV